MLDGLYTDMSELAGICISFNHGSEIRNGNLGRFRFLMKMGFWGIDHRGVKTNLKIYRNQ